MRLPRRHILAGAAALLAAPTVSRAQARTDVRFSLDFAFGGPQSIWTLAAERGYFAAEGLNLQIDRGGGSGDAVQRAAGGAYDVAWADINVMIRFNGANPTNTLQSFFVTYDAAPHAVVVLKGRGVERPKDLEGKRLAAPEFDAGRQLFPLFAKHTNVELARVEMLNIDIRLREATVVRNDAVGATGFITSVYWNLVGAGAREADIHSMMYSDFGVDIYGSAAFAKPDYLRRNPHVPRGITKAISRAMRDAIQDPAAAVATAARRDPTMNTQIELNRLLMTNRMLVRTAHTAANGVSSVIPARMDRAIKAVSEVYNQAAPALETCYTDAYLPPAAERMLPPAA